MSNISSQNKLASNTPIFDFQIEGAKELDKVLKELPKTFAKSVLKGALKKNAAPMVKAARANARRSKHGSKEYSIREGKRTSIGPPGAMAASIKAWIMKGTVVPAAIAIGPDPTHWYAVFQEYGTPFSPAEPFLRPAFARGKNNFIKNFGIDMMSVLLRNSNRLVKQAYAGKLSTAGRKALGI